MNINKITLKLKQQYPGKKVFITDPKNPGEIICETEPTEEHPAWSTAIAVINFTRPHYHKKLTETYEVLKGELDITINGNAKHFQAGEKVIIPPLTRHFAKGNETWIRVTSSPGWTPEDHILIINDKEISRKTYDVKIK